VSSALTPTTDGEPDSSTTFCSDSEAHFNGFQTFGGSGHTFRHNTIRNPCDQTSAISVGTNTGGVSKVTVENNLLAGGGWTLYCKGSDRDDTPNE
jgi:hypothetical protein